eukprot:9828116-Heterocapsa_arctica.AAC.1
MDFQRITRKEAKHNMPTDATFTLEGANLNQKWKHWNEASEEYLAQEQGKLENNTTEEADPYNM